MAAVPSGLSHPTKNNKTNNELERIWKEARLI
jgi:hypothetical protein